LFQAISIYVDIIIRPKLIEPTGYNFRFIFPFVIAVICIVNLALNLGLRVNKLGSKLILVIQEHCPSRTGFIW